MATFSLGFVGLGMMGLPLAKRLSTVGNHQVLGFDTNAAARDAFAAAGPMARVAQSLEEVARNCTAIVTCLPSTNAADEVFTTLVSTEGPGGADRIWIDVSSNPPDVAIRLAQKALAAGAMYIEAPVVGGIADAAAGELHILVSHGLASGLPDLANEILGLVATRVYEAGAPGQASTIKALQNALGLIQLNAIAEVLSVCHAAGVDPKTFSEFVASAPGMANSPLFRRVAPEMVGISNEFTSRLAIAKKDASIGEQIANTAGARHDMLTLSGRLFGEADAKGLGEADFTSVIEIFNK